jgi:hypothetical protein
MCSRELSMIGDRICSAYLKLDPQASGPIISFEKNIDAGGVA